MKSFWHSAVAAGTLAAAILGTPGAYAGPTFDDKDLRGEYLFSGIELHRPMSGGLAPEHCVFAGMVTFDGQGTATLSGMQRCAVGTTISGGPFAGSQYYSVSPDGSFLMSESPDMSDPVHGQIVDHGRSLLLDGTLRTRVDIVNWLGIAMRR